ncbi:MAG: DUF4837 family protein [Bacteroidota bacterium]
MVRSLSKLSLMFSVCCLFLAACTSSPGGGNKAFLQPATGKPGDMIIVMDSVKWNGPLGKEVRKVFMGYVEGLPREETTFDVTYIDPRKLNSLLKNIRNLVFVTSLDGKTEGTDIMKNYFTQRTLDRIASDPDLYLFLDKDVFAKGQEVMYLVGQDDGLLMNNIEENGDKLIGHFNSLEMKRLEKSLFKAKEVKGITDMLERDHKCSIRIPFGYQLAANDDRFIWAREVGTEIDKSVFITYKDYTTQDVFKPENIMQLRDSIARIKLFEDPDNPASFVVTETIIPPVSKETTFDGKYAVRTKGLWKTNNLSMGGPFISYVVVDEALRRVYYIEGFVYSPGKPQRETMRELEAILSTFKTSETLPAENS